jgi:hypothetical protein
VDTSALTITSGLFDGLFLNKNSAHFDKKCNVLLLALLGPYGAPSFLKVRFSAII